MQVVERFFNNFNCPIYFLNSGYIFVVWFIFVGDIMLSKGWSLLFHFYWNLHSIKYKQINIHVWTKFIILILFFHHYCIQNPGSNIYVYVIRVLWMYKCKWIWETIQLYYIRKPVKGKAKKIIMCVYCHMSKKSRVGRSALFFFFTIGKTGNSRSDSGITFSKFPVSRYLLKLFYDELHSFSTFFALNFDKKLAVE